MLIEDNASNGRRRDIHDRLDSKFDRHGHPQRYALNDLGAASKGAKCLAGHVLDMPTQ